MRYWFSISTNLWTQLFLLFHSQHALYCRYSAHTVADVLGLLRFGSLKTISIYEHEKVHTQNDRGVARFMRHWRSVTWSITCLYWTETVTQWMNSTAQSLHAYVTRDSSVTAASGSFTIQALTCLLSSQSLFSVWCRLLIIIHRRPQKRSRCSIFLLLIKACSHGRIILK